MWIINLSLFSYILLSVFTRAMLGHTDPWLEDPVPTLTDIQWVNDDDHVTGDVADTVAVAGTGWLLLCV